MLDRFRRWTLALGAFFLPVEYLPIGNLGQLPITPAKVSGMLLLVMAALQWVSSPRRFPRSGKHVWMIAFGFSFLVANVVAILSGLPFLSVLPLLVTDVALLSFYLVIPILVRTRRDLDWTLSALLLGAVLVAASALMGVGVVLTQASDASQDRMGGLGGNPNEAAGYIAVALPLCVAFFSTSRSLLIRAAVATSLVLLVVAGFSTLSRALFLAIPAMWLFGALRLGRIDFLRYGLLSIILAAVLLAVVPGSVRDRIATLGSGEVSKDTSVQSRVQINRIGLEAFLEHPVEGVGRRNFMNWAIVEGTPAGNVIHNMYLNVAAEQGLIGLIPFLAIVWLAWSEFSISYRLARRRRDPELETLRVRAALMQTSYLGMLILGLFHPTLEFKGLWLFLALSTVVRDLVERRLRILQPEAEAAAPTRGTDSIQWHADLAAPLPSGPDR